MVVFYCLCVTAWHCSPEACSGESKLMAENIIRATAKSDPDLKVVILRYFNVYGSDPEGRLGELLADC